MKTELVPIEVKKEVSSIQLAVNSLEVKTPDDAEKASEILHMVKAAAKIVTDKKVEITAPLMASLGKIKALFKPLEDDLADADKRTRAKMLAYTISEQERVEEEKAKIMERAKKGTLRQDTAVAKLGAVGDVAKTEGIRVQTRRQLEIVDETLIPREYLVPDREKISKALFADIEVPGAKLVDKKILNVV